MSAEVEDAGSPCIGVCRMDEVSGFCRGCLRTLAEVAGWSGFSNAEKRVVLARLEDRQTVPEGDC